MGIAFFTAQSHASISTGRRRLTSEQLAEPSASALTCLADPGKSGTAWGLIYFALIADGAVQMEHKATELLKRAFSETSEKLSEAQQNGLAKWLLEMLADETEWDTLLAGSKDKLEQLADRASAAYDAGEVELLDPKKL